MYKDFEVIVSSISSAVSEKGFGTFLLLDTEADSAYKTITADDLESLKTTSKAYKLATRLFGQSPRPQQVDYVGVKSVEADAIVKKIGEVANKDWFWLVTTENTPETIKAIAAKVETLDKMYLVTVNSPGVVGEDGTITSFITEDMEFEKTAVGYHQTADAYMAEALPVELSYNPGGTTGKFRTIAGVTASDTLSTDIDKMHKAGMFTYIEQKGILMTSEGISTNGKYIDETVGNLWIKARIEERLLQLAIDSDKILYTNKGIGSMVGVVVGVLTEAVERNIIGEEDGVGMYRVTYKPRQDVPNTDVAKRDYSYIEIEYTLAGAIHSGKVYAKPTYAVVRA